MSLWSRIANVLRRDGVSHEIDEELQAHIDEAIEHGRDPAEVHRAFGSRLRMREESRDAKLITWLDSLRADIARSGCIKRARQARPARARGNVPPPTFCRHGSRGSLTAAHGHGQPYWS